MSNVDVVVADAVSDGCEAAVVSSARTVAEDVMINTALTIAVTSFLNTFIFFSKVFIRR
jgi:hypothetical protein